MEIRERRVGTTTGHAYQPPAAAHEVVLEGGGVTATVWTYGATLVAAHVPDRRGERTNVVVGLPSLAAYEDARNRYRGATLGRYARCVSGGVLRLDGREHHLDANEGRHHIHGGPIGFDRFVWDHATHRSADAVEVRLRLERPDGDQGYPGAVTAETTYRLDGRGRLSFDHRATSTAPTIVGLTNHAYWNLAGGGTIDAQRLAVNATRVILVDDDLIPTGPPVAVEGTRFDLRAAPPLGSAPLDHCFALDDPGWAAELVDEASGRAMRIVTDQPGLQVHSGENLTPARAGICLQTGGWPDAPNRPDFPPARLDPGDTYRHVTTHEFRTL